MKVRLRLYNTRDLDLIALKHIETFRFGEAVKEALVEYVQHGECSKIKIPNIHPIVTQLKNEQVDILFNEVKHKAVIDWLLSIRQGLRSSAVKTVFRSSIANPNLDLYHSDSQYIVLPKIRKMPEILSKSKIENIHNKNPQYHSQSSIMTSSVKEVGVKASTKKELDLFEDIVFDNL